MTMTLNYCGDGSALLAERVAKAAAKRSSCKGRATAIYATHDSNGSGWISQNANITKCFTLSEAEAFLMQPFDLADLAEEGLKVEITAGTFGDCWIKSRAAPKVGDSWIAPFSRSQIYVQRPGQHPGGFGYWSTPRCDVLVASVVPAN